MRSLKAIDLLGTSLLGVAVVTTLQIGACKPKEKAKTPPAEPAQATAAAEVEAPPPSPPPVPVSQHPAASEEERALVSEFLPRFSAIIASAKSEGWGEFQSKRQLEKLLADDAISTSYAAWVVGTKPILEDLKTADFRLEKLPTGQLLLTFDSIPVPNDPESAYLIHLVVEDGKLKIDEN